MDWNELAKGLKTQNWIILLVLASASYFLMNPAFTLGIVSGGIIIIANFNFLQHTIRKAFSSEGAMTRGKRSIVVRYYLRLFLLALVLYPLVARGLVDPVGLVVGLSIVVISIFGFAIRNLRKFSSGEAI